MKVMADILEQIVAHKRMELREMKRRLPLERLRQMVERQLAEQGGEGVTSMRAALMASPTGIIAEFKRKSPSRGWIQAEARPAEIALEYQRNGASALSVLTDQAYFGGCPEHIVQVRQAGVTLPVLYKNFVIDPYQLLVARLCGASAVLLIAACLGREECARLRKEARELGLEVLLEMHDERELDYADVLPDMYGVNNRHLGTFATNVETSFRLASLLPRGECLVSESGLRSPEVVDQLRRAGYRGFLIGERFMSATRPGEALGGFIQSLR